MKYNNSPTSFRKLKRKEQTEFKAEMKVDYGLDMYVRRIRYYWNRTKISFKSVFSKDKLISLVIIIISVILYRMYTNG